MPIQISQHWSYFGLDMWKFVDSGSELSLKILSYEEKGFHLYLSINMLYNFCGFKWSLVCTWNDVVKRCLWALAKFLEFGSIHGLCDGIVLVLNNGFRLGTIYGLTWISTRQWWKFGFKDGVKLGTIKNIKFVSVYELRDGVALELKFNLRDPVDC